MTLSLSRLIELRKEFDRHCPTASDEVFRELARLQVKGAATAELTEERDYYRSRCLALEVDLRTARRGRALGSSRRRSAVRAVFDTVTGDPYLIAALCALVALAAAAYRMGPP